MIGQADLSTQKQMSRNMCLYQEEFIGSYTKKMAAPILYFMWDKAVTI